MCVDQILFYFVARVVWFQHRVGSGGFLFQILTQRQHFNFTPLTKIMQIQSIKQNATHVYRELPISVLKVRDIIVNPKQMLYEIIEIR